ncbi:CDK-activating kinase assembly factor [Auricularia subglabra TFB-10046 SS5]|nr:CDK-activating kinase assembly factor [Auricularia subglabra TFB-10046 SS5]
MSSQLASARASTSAQQSQPTSISMFSGGVKDSTGKTQEYSSQDDQCPVCKSDRYLNPKLRLLVSSCYHKMCESCIDRLFTLGPAPCPVCGQIQRKMAFAPQTFEDLTVEKEVAIRRRIHKEFNKRREDFIDLKAYNDYLEEVEDITFNLINGIDVEETNARITRFRAENAAIIEQNLQLDECMMQELLEEEERERNEREARAREMRSQEDAERAEREQERRELIDKLQSSDAPASKVIKQARSEAQKKLAQRAIHGTTRSAAQLLRSRAAIALADPPHLPLSDNWWDYSDRFTLQRTYDDPLSDAVRADTRGIFRAGGYRVEEAWERAIRYSVAGLEISPVNDSPDVVMSTA